MPAKSRTTRKTPPAAPVIAPDILDDAVSVALTPLAGVANAAPPANALSGGFKAALGKKPAGFHDDGKDLNAAWLARLAKAGPGQPQTKVAATRPIGPRSGHR